MKRVARMAAVLGALAMLSGCVSTPELHLYAGAKRPVQELSSLTMAATVEISAIDGREVVLPLLGADKARLWLQPGEHLLMARYKQLFDLTADDHDVVRSGPVLLRFVSEAGQFYQLTHAMQPTRDQARIFAREPLLFLEKASLEKASLEQVSVSTPQDKAAPVAVSQALPTVPETSLLTRVLAAVPAGDADMTRIDSARIDGARIDGARIDGASVDRSTAATAAGGNRLQQLQQLWHEASAEEKKSFRYWQVEHP